MNNVTKFDGRLCGLRVTKALELAFRAIAEKNKTRILDEVRQALSEYVAARKSGTGTQAQAEPPPTPV